MKLPGQEVDSEDEGYDYNDQDPESKELRTSVTRRPISNWNQIQNQNFGPTGIIYNSNTHLPPAPQVRHMQAHISQVPNRRSLLPTRPQKKKKKKKIPQMNPDLVKLKGAKVEQSYDLSKRGFPTEWRSNSPIVHERWVVFVGEKAEHSSKLDQNNST